MYGLSVGISRVGEVLPQPVYALLSGLNAATVGIIALAAVQLAQKAITDKLTRTLVFLGATAGMLYNALWYFPLLMFIAGAVTVVWDFRCLHPVVEKVSRLVRRNRMADERHEIELNPASERPLEHQRQSSGNPHTDMAANMSAPPVTTSIRQTSSTAEDTPRSELPIAENDARTSLTGTDERQDPRVIPADRELNISWQFGLILIVGFLVTFVAIMVLRGVLKYRPLPFSLFANLYLAGTIIFGGGPVVIPLLREYVVYYSSHFDPSGRWLTCAHQICCCRRLGIVTGFSLRSGHHPGVPGAKLQL